MSVAFASRESGICLLTLSNYVWLARRTVLHAATTADAVAIGATNPADKHDAVAMGATSGAAAADGPGRRHATLVTSSGGPGEFNSHATNRV